MKKTILSALLAVTAFGQVSQEPTLVPASKDFALEWDAPNREDVDFYRLYLGNATYRTFTTNDFTIRFTTTNIVGAATNIVTTLRATLTNGITKGTNSIYLIASNGMEDSPPSNVLLLRALGKPAPPQGLRKP